MLEEQVLVFWKMGVVAVAVAVLLWTRIVQVFLLVFDLPGFLGLKPMHSYRGRCELCPHGNI